MIYVIEHVQYSNAISYRSEREISELLEASKELAAAQSDLECYISEAHDEGINSDVAFAQMCLETGFLKFGGAVTEDMHNYCGLGATGSGAAPDRFPTLSSLCTSSATPSRPRTPSSPFSDAVDRKSVV